MADAELEAEDSSEDGGGGGGGVAAPHQSGRAARVAPLGPEQLRRVLEQVAKARLPAEPPPFVLQDAAQRLRNVAQQAALQRGPGAEPPRAPRLLTPQVSRRRRGEAEARRAAEVSRRAGGRAQAAPPLPLGGLRAAQRRRPGSAGVELRRPRPELHGRGSLSRARWPPAQGSSSRPLFIPRLWSSLFEALPWVREVQP